MPKNTLPRSRRDAAPKPSQESNAKAAPTKSLHETWQTGQETAAAQRAARTAQLAASLDLKDLDVDELAFLAVCQIINRRSSGCTSPFEEFFLDLAECVERGDWPTPEYVAQELETFRDNFVDMRKWSARFTGAYPATGKPVPAADAESFEEGAQSRG